MKYKNNYSIELGFSISSFFFYDLWNLISDQLPCPYAKEHFRFLKITCLGPECCDDWNNAVFKETKVPKTKQHEVVLSLTDVFTCAMHFCEINNIKSEYLLGFARGLLERMRSASDDYPNEWSVWNQAVFKVQIQKKKRYFNWELETPKITFEKGYSLCLNFLNDLGALLSIKLPVSVFETFEHFFPYHVGEALSGISSMKEDWRKAVFQIKKLPSETFQCELLLSFDELFLSVIEFVRINGKGNECGCNFQYIIDLLESMKRTSEDYLMEIQIWKRSIADSLTVPYLGLE